MTEGIAGDPSLLLSKAVLDGFTALIFACVLGFALCVIALPQLEPIQALSAHGEYRPGVGNGLLNPGGLATRAQVAQILKNYLDQ